MSTIAPNKNNSVFEETKYVLRDWLLETKQLDIWDKGSVIPKYAVYDMSGYSISNRSATIFEHASYAACVKFALEYERKS